MRAKSPPWQSLQHVSNKSLENRLIVPEYHLYAQGDRPRFQYHAVCFCLIQYYR